MSNIPIHSSKVPAWKSGEGQSRSPCPMLNVLANHSLLPFDGKKLTPDIILSAIHDNLKMSRDLFTDIAKRALELGYEENGVKYFDLGDLAKHNKIEHDVSLTRHDAAVGDNCKMSPELYAAADKFTEMINGKKYLTYKGLVQWRAERIKLCKEAHPETFFFPFGAAKFFAAIENSFILNHMQDETGNVRMDWLDVWIKEERFPFELGYEIRYVSTFEMYKTTAGFIWNIGFF